MTSQPSSDRSAQQDGSRLWRAPWPRRHDVGRLQFRAQRGSESTGRISLAPAARPIPFSPLPDARVLSGLALAAALIIAIVAGVSMPAGCQVPQLSLNLGSDAAISVAVPAAKACAISVTAGSATVKTLKIDSPPAHGQLLPRGRTGVVYIPQSGFAGEDAFVFSIEGNSSSGSGAALFRVKATVQ